MSNDFLPYFITEELYLIKEEQKETHPQAEKPIDSQKSIPGQVGGEQNSLATKQHYKMIVVTGAINDQDKLLLTKVLEAVAVKISDAELLIELPASTVSYDKMLVFTSGSTQRLYTPVSTEQGVSLYSQPLSVLHTSREDKVLLWNALKSWFTVS